MPIRIAIDCMGGDHGLPTTIPAALNFLSHKADAYLLLVGNTEAIQAALQAEMPRHARTLSMNSAEVSARYEIVQASEIVSMDDSIEVALRRKRDSSMRVAIRLVKDGRADACVSAGNTGALMAISRNLLKTLDGIDRPAIATHLPNQTGGATTMLDLGANVDCEPEHLLQFAIMGSALVAATEGKDKPTVGLLNIGEEVIKGNDTVKRAGELLRASTLNFYGNVEGNDIFKGTTDVVVCDGFVGNVALKTSEGLAQMIGGFIKEEFTRSFASKIAALIALPVLKRFRARTDHRRYNGASLLGLRGLVIKSHGSADAYSFEWALKRGYDATTNHVVERIAQGMAQIPKELPVVLDDANLPQCTPQGISQ